MGREMLFNVGNYCSRCCLTPVKVKPLFRFCSTNTLICWMCVQVSLGLLILINFLILLDALLIVSNSYNTLLICSFFKFLSSASFALDFPLYFQLNTISVFLNGNIFSSIFKQSSTILFNRPFNFIVIHRLWESV